MSQDPIPLITPPEPPAPQTLVCANCHAALSGEYCAACGQRHEPHIHTVGHFAGEAFESISHADSRLWRTLWLLFSRPGFLTREFFAGRRVAYLPPFRLYLVLSVIFFLVTSLTSSDEPPIKMDEPVSAETKAEVNEALKQSGVPIRPWDEEEKALGKRKVVRIDGLDDFCKAFDGPEKGGDGAKQRENVRRFCAKVRYDTTALVTEVLHSVPKAMFLFLPLLAAFMKLLYWRPKRYYVEHLLFLVHNHAAVFLTFSIVGLFSLVPYVGGWAGFLVFVSIFYLIWYIFRAMRNVYGQHGFLTFLKYTVIGWAYLITAVFTLLLTMIFLALMG